jgi:hypothetical protein
MRFAFPPYGLLLMKLEEVRALGAVNIPVPDVPQVTDGPPHVPGGPTKAGGHAGDPMVGLHFLYDLMVVRRVPGVISVGQRHLEGWSETGSGGGEFPSPNPERL